MKKLLLRKWNHSISSKLVRREAGKAIKEITKVSNCDGKRGFSTTEEEPLSKKQTGNILSHFHLRRKATRTDLRYMQIE